MNTFNSSNYNDLFQNVKLVVKETPKQQEEKLDTNTIVANKKVKLKKENIFMLPNSKMENEKVEEEKTEVKAPPELESPPPPPPSEKRPVGKRGADKKDRKKRRDMTPARLEHLKKAREKALAKRRENAAKRRAEKAAKAAAASAPVQQPPPAPPPQPTKKSNTPMLKSRHQCSQCWINGMIEDGQKRKNGRKMKKQQQQQQKRRPHPSVEHQQYTKQTKPIGIVCFIKILLELCLY